MAVIHWLSVLVTIGVAHAARAPIHVNVNTGPVVTEANTQQSQANLGPLVDVFTKGENGYFCIKIPYLLNTINGTLIALAEARMFDCSDYTWTDLVMKRSTDGGKTWSPLSIFYANSTRENKVVIGNAAPVQDKSTGRILIPFNRNNYDILLSYSDDDGVTWAPVKNLTRSLVAKPEWKWVGLGPPAGLQLSSGRIVIPAYHTYEHWDDGDVSHGHVMLSDDGGNTWKLGGEMNANLALSNECQAVELSNNTIMINSRAALYRRLRTVSTDGGETMQDTTIIDDLPQPFQGCEGSTIKHPQDNKLYYSGLHEADLVGYRYNLSLHSSADEGKTWTPLVQIDPSYSGYSALITRANGDIGCLYERAKDKRLIFVPDQISYRVVLPRSNTTVAPMKK